MKYFWACAMLGGLAVTFIAILAGLAYHFDGYGFHPALATFAGLAGLSVGWYAADRIGDD